MTEIFYHAEIMNDHYQAFQVAGILMYPPLNNVISSLGNSVAKNQISETHYSFQNKSKSLGQRKLIDIFANCFEYKHSFHR